MASLNELSLLSKEWEQHFEAGYPLELETVTNPRVQVISRFSRYVASVAALPVTERQKIDRIADFIANALRSGRDSVRTVRLTGHADVDTPRRPAFEHQVARARALDVLEALSLALERVERASGRALPPYSSRVAWEVKSAGATRLLVPNPRTELDRSRNRRVEISLLPYKTLPSQIVTVGGPKFSLTTRVTLDVRTDVAIEEFLRRAPNDALRYDHPKYGRDLADRRVCVSAVAAKAAQLCSSTNSADRGGIPCRGVLTLSPREGGRCYSRMVGSQFLAGKDYRAPLTEATRAACCTRLSQCSAKTRLALPVGQYLVLKYQPGPLKKMVDGIKCLLDRGCVVPAGVLSGYCDDMPDLSKVCERVPLPDKWRDCWEHWLLIIGYDGDRFVFWDSAEASARGPLKPDKDEHYFGFLYYDSTNHRLTTATTNPRVTDPLEVDSSGFHTQGFPFHAQKRYQVTSMWNGLPWKDAGAPCSLT
jgi:hypothetical protein